jgi:hypothetical protein
MSEARKERRRKAKVDDRTRQDDVDKKLEEPKLPSFEAPPSGKVIENPRTRKA